MIRTCLVFVLLASLPLPVAAGELIPPNAIASVTVFGEGAQIVRRVPVVLPAGSTTVVIGDLPADIEADSLEIDGSADQPLAITSVETRVAPADPDKDPKSQGPVQRNPGSRRSAGRHRRPRRRARGPPPVHQQPCRDAADRVPQSIGEGPPASINGRRRHRRSPAISPPVETRCGSCASKSAASQRSRKTAKGSRCAARAP